jgi:hypothetical protein
MYKLYPNERNPLAIIVIFQKERHQSPTKTEQQNDKKELTDLIRDVNKEAMDQVGWISD